jgi:hypothetical protein
VETIINVRSIENCILCGNKGKKQYQNLEDQLYSIPGKWDFMKCTNMKCGLYWLDPMFIENEIDKVYQNYYTHEGRNKKTNNFIRASYIRAM